MRTLQLKAGEYEDEGHFILRLVDLDSSVPDTVLAANQLDLEAADPLWQTFCSLPEAWIALGRLPGWVESEHELIGALGTWVSKSLLGPISETLFELAPATVWIDQESPVPNWLLEAPLAIATQRDERTDQEVSLAHQRVVFSVEFEFPKFRQSDSELRPLPLDQLRVLAAFSSPTDERELSLRQERYQLAWMAREMSGRNSRELDLKVLQYGATARSLRNALEDAEGWDIVHLSGHGQAGQLMFEGDTGRGDPVNADSLLQWFDSANKSRLKLVTLMACCSAATVVRPWFAAMGVGMESDEDPFEGKVEQSLASQIAARIGCTVVAMRYPVRDRFCIDFTGGLYRRMWEHKHSALGAVGLGLRDSSERQPTSLFPSRSTFTPAVFGNTRIADVRLAPPARTGPAPILNPKMASFKKEPEVFVGRVSVLAAVNAALAPRSDKSGVVLHGPAGVGKSHCALEIAHGRQDDFDPLHSFRFKAGDGNKVKPNFGDLTHDLVAVLRVRTTDPTANFNLWLDQITEAMERGGALLVFDQVDLLLTGSGAWIDPRWSRLFGALCNHDGGGRTLITSRLDPPYLRGIAAIEVKNFSAKETVLLAQQLPKLSERFDGSGDSGPSLREILSISRGNPELLRLADSVADDPVALRAMLEEAKQVWAASNADPDGFMNEGATDDSG